VEGDSQIIISMLSKLKNGSETAKISTIWTPLGSLESPKNMISPHMVIIPSHVRKEANNIVDKLVNDKIDKKKGDLHCSSNQFPVHPLFRECLDLET
jgi:hypothetical protein